MAQVTEMMRSGSEECQFVGSVAYILKKTNPKTKSNSDDRQVFVHLASTFHLNGLKYNYFVICKA